MPGPAAYILDLDGVVYHGKSVIPGAARTIERLKAAGSRVIFLTNNATRTREAIAGKLEGMGIRCHAGDVISSAYATSLHIRHKYGPSTIFPIGELGLITELEREGHSVAMHDVDFVVVGLDRQFTYDKLASGLANLRNGAGFIATNTDAMLPTEDDFLPGAGSMVAALAAASGMEPEVVGKPNRPIMDVLLLEYGLEAGECIMVGDRLETDILGGKNAGMRTVLVLTGASRREDIKVSGIRPDTILNSIADIE
ncbi:MAG: HAD-IIA family hydrolase [Methanosarcinales archaeon]|nr:HAD-IIA family hydrolase [ANME-2 cluster archaeon]MDW7776325.1 HAD-IIA family hydrolase [Methanosarcinales archaeon]